MEKKPTNRNPKVTRNFNVMRMDDDDDKIMFLSKANTRVVSCKRNKLLGLLPVL